MMTAGIMVKMGQYQEAITLYDAILAHNPGIDAAANNLAQAITDYEYTDTAALAKARQTAERFVSSTNPLYLDTLGWVYYRQGNFQQAQTIMERVMAAKDELPPEVHYHYGSLLLKMGKPEEAKAQLRMATIEGAGYAGREEAKKALSDLH
jgi:predicted Zn-dependent protease